MSVFLYVGNADTVYPRSPHFPLVGDRLEEGYLRLVPTPPKQLALPDRTKTTVAHVEAVYERAVTRRLSPRELHRRQVKPMLAIQRGQGPAIGPVPS